MHDDWIDDSDVLLLTALRTARFPIVAADLRQPDNPLMFVNAAFEALTGYAAAEAIGRNCRFLQGPGTDPETVASIRAAIAAGEEARFELLNYRKDSTPFWNGLHISPVMDADGEPYLYLGYQRDITDEVEARGRQDLLTRELRHRLGNLMAIVRTIVRTSRGDGGEDSLRRVLDGRLSALAASNELVYPRHRSPDEDGKMPAGPLVREVLRTVLAPIEGAGNVVLRGPDAVLADAAVTNVALAVHELSTNALKYGALSGVDGRIEISWRREGAFILIDWIETGIAPAARDAVPSRRGMGTRLLTSLADASHRPDAGLKRTKQSVTFRFDAAAA